MAERPRQPDPEDAAANPFASGPFASGDDQDASSSSPRRPSSDPSIEFEPHLRGYTTSPADEDWRADRSWAVDADLSEDDSVEHTVWDEPALSGDLSGPPPEGQLTYARWLEKQIAATSEADAWRTTLLVALAAGPWGVVGAMWSQMTAGSVAFSGMLAAVILAPVTEEITKVAAALWVVEKRPFRFKRKSQILLCAAAGGLIFAAIENVIYLAVYNPGGGPAYAAWRWIVCTALHVTCSTITGVGLAQIWHDAITGRRRPELAIGMPMFTVAMVLHGLYNAAATLAEVSGALSFE